MDMQSTGHPITFIPKVTQHVGMPQHNSQWKHSLIFKVVSLLLFKPTWNGDVISKRSDHNKI